MKQYLGGPSTLLSHTQFLQEKFYDLLWIIDKPNDVYTLGRIITLDHRWQTEFGDRWEQKYWARSGIVPDAFITPSNYSYDVIIGRDDSITCFKVLTKDKWNRTESKHISTKFPIFLQLIVKKDSIWQMCIIEKNMHIYENEWSYMTTAYILALINFTFEHQFQIYFFFYKSSFNSFKRDHAFKKN